MKCFKGNWQLIIDYNLCIHFCVAIFFFSILNFQTTFFEKMVGKIYQSKSEFVSNENSNSDSGLLTN